MSTRGLLEHLAEEGLVERDVLDQATPAGQTARAALAGLTSEGLHLQQAGTSVSVWLGALLMALFLVQMDVTEVVPLGLMLGAAGLALAAVLARGTASVLELQLRWIATIGGQILILASLAEVFSGDKNMLVATIVLQAVTLAVVRDLAIGAAAVMVAAGAALGLAAELRVGPFGHGLVALFLGTCTCALWVQQARLLPQLGRLWQPLAYALPLVVWAPITMGLDQRGGDELPLFLLSPGDIPPGALALSAGWAALSTWLIGQAGRERPELRGKSQWFAWAAVWLTALFGLDTPGLGAGLTLLLLGQLRASWSLRQLGLVAIGSFLFLWYYEHGTTLLTKSIVAVSHGLLFLVLATVLRRGADRPRESQARPLPARIADLRWLSLALALGLAIPGYVVFQKEQVLASGETVLLPLAPVDPRSLMQGDYMELRYALIRELGDVDRLAPRGTLVITRDADHVAQFVRVDDGQALAPGELRLRYAKRGSEVSLGAETFLFPEGEGPTLAAARYGELAVAPAGDSVLIGLRDEARRPLGTRLHDR
ncbi:GDYXXLXY domain-containing protein [Nannocystis radixulma]|uniref:GDYXXLXY domain-containing protein n=1 Tax=Nannocystis radixulma TaxID=2995305 RepID=A0ABT5BBV2_9BACT|nr:GDYXXLXY domain-containing protein [Nannocystis radixulma]MDC0671606.1 GDYXXLXY domain-containing protein [Nannocystis radixulma]